jgi:hypothetical protein
MLIVASGIIATRQGMVRQGDDADSADKAVQGECENTKKHGKPPLIHSALQSQHLFLH